jgi:hypothetical protein
LFAVTFTDGETEPFTRRGIRRSNLRYSVEAFADAQALGLVS